MYEHYEERQEGSCAFFPCKAEVFIIGKVDIARMFEIENSHVMYHAIVPKNKANTAISSDAPIILSSYMYSKLLVNLFSFSSIAPFLIWNFSAISVLGLMVTYLVQCFSFARSNASNTISLPAPFLYDHTE